ncbi:hypothetical protein JQ615_22095 [Bradyrhizobium jicamae]|uniref:Uncharacterized protein n=1 Tax=Bradyrhizobium jicamae TaxID=280332 RepID=A0ABS5FMT6_9BRAD|nr:hypothetical protein [Bradyrhizobium jicamae]MBR0798087.1 hypothetical protein [Bradyrhizobium jicamae]MBR0934475.1 hypothetical protein [Bradyrhizobium jicamae]
MNNLTRPEVLTGFATGWPEQQPDVMVISLKTAKGAHDFVLNKEQALLMARTIKQTAEKLPKPRTA